MAHGLSLELAKIEAPKWRSVDPEKQEPKKRRIPKKIKNRMFRNIKRQRPQTTRQEFNEALSEHYFKETRSAVQSESDPTTGQGIRPELREGQEETDDCNEEGPIEQ